MKELTILMVVLLLIFIWTTYLRKNLYLTRVKSDTGHSYLVRKLPDKQEAANKLGKITTNLQTLCDHCKSSETGDKQEAVNRLIKKFKTDRIIERIPGSQYVAHSVNKGEELSLCIRDKGSDQLITDNNTIIFVAIHELAHIMSSSTGHTDEFWDNMKYLLEQGSKIGIYTLVDYSKNPTVFCGMTINSSPYKFSDTEE